MRIYRFLRAKVLLFFEINKKIEQKLAYMQFL